MVSVSFYGPAMTTLRSGPSAPRARQKVLQQQQYRPPGRSFYATPAHSTPKHSSVAESVSLSKQYGVVSSSYTLSSSPASSRFQRQSVIASFAGARRGGGAGERGGAGGGNGETKGGKGQNKQGEEGGGGRTEKGRKGETRGGKGQNIQGEEGGGNYQVRHNVVGPSTPSLQGGPAAYPLTSNTPVTTIGGNVGFSHSPDGAGSSSATGVLHKSQPASADVTAMVTHYASVANPMIRTSPTMGPPPPQPTASASAPQPPANKSRSLFPLPRVQAGATWVPKLHPVNLHYTSVTPTNHSQPPAVSSTLVREDVRWVGISAAHDSPSRTSSEHVSSSNNTSKDTGFLRSEAIAIAPDRSSVYGFMYNTDPPPPFYEEKSKPPKKNGNGVAGSVEATRDWCLEAQQLREQVFALDDTRVEDFTHLAEQAVEFYTAYIPTVLCDLRDITFWYRNPTERGPNGEMILPMSDNGAQLFATTAFFEALAQETTKRMSDIHPISVVYLLWTFTRKFGAKNIPSVYRSASPYLTRHLEDLDRCGIGMVPWCYAKANIFDEQLLEACANDLCRRTALDIDQHSPIPEHQLAPRNVQNTCWAYARAFHRRPKPNYLPNLFQEMARVAHKLLQHRPKDGPKTSQTLCRGYTTETGKLIPADSFRLMSLGLIAKSFKDVGIGLPAELDVAMEQYTLQGLALSPYVCDKFFLIDSYDVVLASRMLTLTPALTEALKRVAGRHLSRLKPQDKVELRVLGISAIA
eukprot:GEMP01010134.1.p1 GENE.GEMP01010134.1~~GEMP01010134.1.p1  ORF type:complete len:749 (+),score=143.88 GEMP01010134.1:385-2631(+)